jgi:hypothetical protein
MKGTCTPRLMFRLLSALALVAASASVNAASMDARIVARVDALSFQRTMYGTLDVLEAAVRDSRPPVVEVDICGAKASRAAMAVVQRLSDLSLRLRPLDENAPACRARAVAMPAGQRASSGPLDVDAAAVKSYWQQVAP